VHNFRQKYLSKRKTLRPKHRCEDDVRLHIKEIESYCVGRIILREDRIQGLSEGDAA